MTEEEMKTIEVGDRLYDKEFLSTNPNHIMTVHTIEYDDIGVSSNESIKNRGNRFWYSKTSNKHIDDLEFYVDSIYLKNIYKNFSKEQIAILKKSIEF